MLAGLGLRYRDAAKRRLDQKFFRSEYHAREILLSLASRIPGESDPRALVSLVLGDIEAALHPQHAAILAGSGDSYETVHAAGLAPAPLRGTSGLSQLLQWSDTPLEVALHDPRSPAARLPASDREWLETAGAVLLVPIAAGTGAERPLVGFIVLGPKKSEEPYSTEDRKLLGSIAAQMGVALDLSRLRREAISTPRGASSTPHTFIESPWRGIDVGMTIEGKYRVDALIGRGGMGAVYRARDLRLDRDVAVKVVRGELVASAEARDRFQREAQLVARLQHPAIVTVFDYGTLPDGAAYLVMEYVRGEDLRARLSRKARSRRPTPFPCSRPLPRASRPRTARACCIVIRSPRTCCCRLVGAEGAGFRRRQVDAGRRPGRHPHRRRHHRRDTAYMAPEQIRGERVDARTDIFSLAVICYEMLTGRLPDGGVVRGRGNAADVRDAGDRRERRAGGGERGAPPRAVVRARGAASDGPDAGP